MKMVMIFLIQNTRRPNSKIYRKCLSLETIILNNWYAFRKVLLMEDEDQNMHLKNLSVHAAQNEEEALNLLFLGDTNRMIAEVRTSIKIISTNLWIFKDANESSVDTFALYLYNSCHKQRDRFCNCSKSKIASRWFSWVCLAFFSY